MPATAELLAGYYLDTSTCAWLTLPWSGVDACLPTLGFDVIEWCQDNLSHHLTGTPWRFTPGQQKFLLLWYAFDSNTGRWRYRSGVKRGAKGTGKDPFGAALVAAEFVGPVSLKDDWRERVARGDERGLGQRHRMSLVQIAANSEAQAADLLRVANAMLGLEVRAAEGIETGVTRTVADCGSRVELLTASEKSSEGDPATAIVLNESHHMTETSGGHKIAAVARRNVAKSPVYVQARLVELTNAHQQGQESVAERSFQAWQNQVSRAGRVDILYDSREAPPDTDITDDESMMAGLEAAYGDSPWSDLERLRDEALDTRTSVADTVRYYFNGLAAAEDAWIDPQRFDSQARVDIVVADGDRIAMFLDCSKSEDATGLVAARIDDGHVITLGVWQRPRGLPKEKRWLAPRGEVDAVVRAAFDRYKVVWFGVDPSPATEDSDEALYWAEVIDGWHRSFRNKLPLWATPGEKLGHSVKFDMRLSQSGGVERNKTFTEAAQQTALDIDGEVDEAGQFTIAPVLTHDGDSRLRTHTHNARRRPNKWGVSLGKVTRDSFQLVDLAVCMVGARMGRTLFLNSKHGQKKSRRGQGRVVVRR